MIRRSRLVRRTALAVPIATALAFVVAACGGGSSTAAPASIPAGAVQLSAADYAFTPSSLSVPAGAVTFAVANTSAQNHEFEVMTGETSLGKIEAFGSGTTQTLSVTLQPGAYQYVCRLNGHDVLGMKGELQVT